MIKVFNRGIAAGDGFCNRVNETAALLKNVRNLTHTLLISPRRYGKTSLALHVLEKAKLPYAYLDFFMKYDHDDIYQEFYLGIGSLISKVIKPTEKAMRLVEKLLKNIKISLTVGKLGLEFSLAPTVHAEKNLRSLFLGLEELLAKNNKCAIMFIDEVQAITESMVRDEFEAAVRFIAQKTEHICFIFSGSNRHLLGKIFEDRSRPFYKLCQIVPITRIVARHYEGFINSFAISRWGKPLMAEVLDAIFRYTKVHPYYVNILCEKLFAYTNLPDSAGVDECWQQICKEEQGAVAKDVEFLTPKQKHLLAEIAKYPNLKMPTAQNFVNLVDLTPRGISQALALLLKHGIVEKLEDGEIRIIDPVLEYWSQ